MNILNIGLNHKTCPVATRERFAFSKQALPEAVHRMKQTVPASEWFLLSTCNRVEACFVTDRPHETRKGFEKFLSEIHQAETGQFEFYLYQYQDEEAVKHLFRVSCGLDSLVLGENEILGQIKEAYQLAQAEHASGPVLSRLLERALTVSKQARTQTRINEGAVSVPSAAVELAEKIFGRLHGEKVLVLGSGEMSALLLKHLVSSGAGAILIAGRREEKAKALACPFNAEVIPWDAWTKSLEQVDIVISSTSAPGILAGYEAVAAIMSARRHKPLFFIDIAVPRNIDARVGAIDDVYLYNIDDLKSVVGENLKGRKKEIEACERMIFHHAEEFSKWQGMLDSSEVIRSFRDYVTQCVEEEVERHLKQISSEERKILIDRIRGKILHAPLEKLKEAAGNGATQRYLEVIEALFRKPK
ncbi:MAG: glutamyl-tRNA reductase [Candidatus Omnitrophica bacterium]|nr:glutamyl-tRNA reductase [Candidatus Omnitrophota bacterium]